MITITAREDRLLEKRSLPFPRRISALACQIHPLFPPLPSRHLFFSFVRLSASLGLGVMTAAPRCVRKLECHVLTGVGGMLTGQTEGTDGSVTCPRSSGVPLLGSLDLKSNTFFFCPFPSCVLSFFQLPPPPASFLPPFILSPLPCLYRFLLSLFLILSSAPLLFLSHILFQCFYRPLSKVSCTCRCLSLLKHTGP